MVCSALKGLIISNGICGQLGAICFFLHIYIYIYFLNEAALVFYF